MPIKVLHIGPRRLERDFFVADSESRQDSATSKRVVGWLFEPAMYKYLVATAKKLSLCTIIMLEIELARGSTDSAPIALCFPDWYQ